MAVVVVGVVAACNTWIRSCGLKSDAVLGRAVDLDVVAVAGRDVAVSIGVVGPARLPLCDAVRRVPPRVCSIMGGMDA